MTGTLDDACTSNPGRTLRSLLMSVVVLAAVQGGFAAEVWQPRNAGLPNLNVRAIAVDPTNENVLYVGTLGGIFKSTNKGLTWVSASSGLVGTTVTGIEIVQSDPTRIYAGTSAGGIHLSTNAGASWTQINNGLPTMSVNAVGVRTDLPSTLYAGMNTFGIGWSLDAGGTWQPSGVMGTIRQFAVDPVTPATVYAATAAGVLKTTDGGASWSPASGGITSPSIFDIAVDTMNPAVVFCGPFTSRVFRSSDGGLSWALSGTGMPIGSTAVAVYVTIPIGNSSAIYAGTDASGVYRSIDGGATWQRITTGLTNLSSNIGALTGSRSNPRDVYVGTPTGVFHLIAAPRCGNGVLEEGEPCDDGNTAAGDCCSSTCQFEAAASPCNDGDACTATDGCNGAGSCVGGSALDCDDGSICTSDTCNSATGCVHTNHSEICDDGSVCTTDTCDFATGCVFTNNTAACNDGNACTSGDTCGGGACLAGAAVSCDDNNPCTTDSCDPATGCVFIDNTDACDDGNACTSGDTCGEGTCQGGPAVTCDDGNACTTDSCNPATGCVFTDNTDACDDGNACTSGDNCGGGTCQGGPAITCDDGNACTTDSCNPATGCVVTNNTVACDDGNACTSGDACGGGTCQGGAAVTCDDDNACTTDSCNPATGCVVTNNTAACDDGNACTSGDACGGGTCHGGEPVTCTDESACTSDTCNPTTGCVHEAISGCGGACTILLVAPSDGSAFASAASSRRPSNQSVPTFTWSSTCGWTYRLEFSNSLGFAHPALIVLPPRGLTGTSFTPNHGNWTAISNMAKNRGGTGTVYWRVVGYGPNRETTRSAARSIVIER